MRYWIGVASRQHVLTAVNGGFAQFGHGKPGPAKRPAKGDWITYYSPKEKLGERGALPAICGDRSISRCSAETGDADSWLQTVAAARCVS
jgi:hypothetical protein